MLKYLIYELINSLFSDYQKIADRVKKEYQARKDRERTSGDVSLA